MSLWDGITMELDYFISNIDMDKERRFRKLRTSCLPSGDYFAKHVTLLLRGRRLTDDMKKEREGNTKGNTNQISTAS